MRRGESYPAHSYEKISTAHRFPSTGVGFQAVLGRYYNSQCSNGLQNCLIWGHFTLSGGGV